ncbi:hypothetical protein BGZ46_008238 [Entomortierella lignicola]|nr:hypothetical protein BGZ46_008238 [Entomortierella lignicola]
MFDLFSTLMTSIRIENRKIRFKSYPNTFLAEDAIAKLGNLPIVRSVLATDPNDPTRIITQVVTTHLSFTRDMAKNICQTLMDSRLIESATEPSKREFQPKTLCQITPKGAHILAKFVYRNKMSLDETRHLTTHSIANLVYLDRADDEDAIILGQDHVDTMFKRFAGPEPNVARFRDTTTNSSTSGTRERTPSVTDLSNGIEVREQQVNDYTFKDTFYGKSAVEWLLDYSSVISKEEAFCICQEMVSAGYIEQIGEENTGGRSLFKSGNAAIYHLTDSGRAIAGWQSLDDDANGASNDWMDDRTSKAERNNFDSSLLSAQFKLTSTNVSRLPISITRDQQRSADENSMTSSQYNEEAVRNSARRLSQILNDPAFQPLSDGTMSSYATSSSGRESVGASSGGGTRISTPSSSIQSTTSNTSRLNGILSDSIVRDLFKSFLKQNICEENLSFYLEVLDYKTKFTGLIDSARAYDQSVFGHDATNTKHTYPPSLRELEKQICTQAFAIFETFLVSGAPREVNLPHQMRQDITAYMQAVVRNMETRDSNSRVNNENLPPTPSSPSTEILEREKTSNGSTRGPKELIHIALFDVIHDHIFRLMSTDSVPKFIKTDKYLEVVMSKHKRKNTSATASPASSTSSLEANGGRNGNYSGNGNNLKTNGGGGYEGEDSIYVGSTRIEDNASLRRSLSLSDHRQYDSMDYFETSYNGNTGSMSKSSVLSSSSSINGEGKQTLIASPNSKVYSLKSPRIRSSSSNVPVEALQQHRTANSLGFRPSRANANGSSVLGSRSPASLMDIYAHQQHLQQYSNQRAQLSPAQLKQMYMLRNTRSTTSLPLNSSASSLAEVAPAVKSKIQPSLPSNGTSLLENDIPDGPTAASEEASEEQKVTVLFESTSLEVEDPSDINVQVQRQNLTAAVSVVAEGQSSILSGMQETLPSSNPMNTPGLCI